MESQPDNDSSSFYTINGSGELPLNVRDGGNRNGTPILFIHGMGRCSLDWQPQFQSDLAKEYRLIAMDLRGHGKSGKPWANTDYHDSRLWADDVLSVINDRKLDNPIFVGWSYGGVVALDYLRVHGSERIRGINFVGNAPLIANGTVPKMLSEWHQSLSMADNIRGNEVSIGLLTKRDLGETWRRQAMLAGMTTPAYVRQAIHTRDGDYTDVVKNLSVPTLVTYGSEDPGYTPEISALLEQKVPGAVISIYQGIGHSPFAEDTERFNNELRQFAKSLK